MSVFLITRNPGSGKSALAHELARRGLPVIDPDDDPELAHWEDAAGDPVGGLPSPDELELNPEVTGFRWASDDEVTALLDEAFAVRVLDALVEGSQTVAPHGADHQP